MDKWLWAARFFKTREQAARACDMNRITSNSLPAKPAREVRVGDLLHIRNEAGESEVRVLELSQQRGPASVAQTLYAETDESKARREKARTERDLQKDLLGWDPTAAASRPCKRDRRLIQGFKRRG